MFWTPAPGLVGWQHNQRARPEEISRSWHRVSGSGSLQVVDRDDGTREWSSKEFPVPSSQLATGMATAMRFSRPSRVVTVHRTQRRLAGREGCSVRKINKTISLAFLAPHLVKAAINGFLRYGLEVARLCVLPAEWFPSAPDVVATTFGPVFTQERSASGKRDSSAQRQTAQNRLQGQKRSPRRPKRSRKSPPIAGFLAVSGKSRGLKECVADLRGL
jgi:hypothetical protein